MLRSGDKGITRLDNPFLQDILQSVDEEDLISIVCDKHYGVNVIMHLAERFDSLGASSIVDSLCAILHKILDRQPYPPCITRYHLLLAKRLGTPEEVAGNPELQARFYTHCLNASLTSDNLHANEILIEQMEKDLTAQPLTQFLTRVLMLSKESTAILYHAGMALLKKDRPLLAACLFRDVVQTDSRSIYTLATNENIALLSTVLENKSDIDRISYCIDMCVSAGKQELPEVVVKAAANFEEKISLSNTGSSSPDSSYESRIQALEKQIQTLQSKVESLELQLTMKPEIHHSPKASSSVTHSIFSETSRRSESNQHTKDVLQTAPRRAPGAT
ncbi:hypothetical protein [Legionella sp. CNM-4043-24]|uniref:hypothetical protein n=1 Tax=Legionella sp. CNM-4043-24 TaxID=3421646 RepID=UPI00403B1929